jgi:aspartate racemase
VSAHFFLNDVQDQINLPIISIYDAVAESIVKDHPKIKTIGLLGTTGTINGGLFQKRLACDGIQTIVSGDTTQSKIMDAIYDIKNTQPARSREEITEDLIAAAESLISQKAKGIIAGCTEIPLALKQEHLPVPYFDALTILARTAILKAGRRPVLLL